MLYNSAIDRLYFGEDFSIKLHLEPDFVPSCATAMMSVQRSQSIIQETAIYSWRLVISDWNLTSRYPSSDWLDYPDSTEFYALTAGVRLKWSRQHEEQVSVHIASLIKRTTLIHRRDIRKGKGKVKLSLWIVNYHIIKPCDAPKALLHRPQSQDDDKCSVSSSGHFKFENIVPGNIIMAGVFDCWACLDDAE